jgi:DNA-binding MarR family transcriptional regulator
MRRVKQCILRSRYVDIYLEVKYLHFKEDGHIMSRPETDPIDLICRQWRRERPELDPSGFEVVGRLLLLGRVLERRVTHVLAPLGLGLGAFDVLATLRRQGPPYELTPTELTHATLLTSGTMTARVDRLEKDGHVERRPDPKDRRGVRVSLTGAGLELVNRAIAVRLDEALDAVTGLGSDTQGALVELLRPLTLDLVTRRHSADAERT